MVVLDLRELPVDAALAIDWAHEPRDAVSIVTVDVPGEWVDAVDRVLRHAGFQRAGRAWGEAGTLRTYRRSTSLRTSLSNAAAESRVRIGQSLVWLLQALPDRHGRMHWQERALARLRGETRLVLGSDGGGQIPPLQRLEVARSLGALSGLVENLWSAPLEPDEGSTRALVEACHDRHGVWPISFSYPRAPLVLNEYPDELIAPIIPGRPYSFTDESDYLQTYRRAHFGLTHRKAGWDCFRHLEIMAAGATPLMLDAADIPAFSMVHYPKQMLAATVGVAYNGSVPSLDTRLALRAFFDRHLTSVAMVRYMLHHAGLSDARRVLFVDERLPGSVDYLSVLTLIGLKQVLGNQCEVMFPVDYIYEDTRAELVPLYGRGFGYTRSVAGESRTQHERQLDASFDSAVVSDFDALVIGSIVHNGALAQHLLGLVPPHKTVWLHGGDEPPPLREVREFIRSGAHVFVRAIGSSRHLRDAR